MKIDNNISLRIAFLGILVFVFWNDFLPTANNLFNFLSPSLNTYNVDFYAYYRGGHAYLRGIDPYNGTSDGQVFIYPPTFIPLYAQLAKLDYETARGLWVGVYSFFFIAAIILLLLRSKPSDRDKMAFIIGLIFFMSYPVKYYIRQGQVDLIVASFCFSSLVLYLWRKHNLSALCLAIATLIKMNPLFLMITFLVFFRDWKYMLRYGTALVGLAAVSLLFFPLDWYRIYVVTVLPSLSATDSHYYQQTLARFFFAGDATKTRLLTLIGNGLFTVGAWLLGYRYRDQLQEIRTGTITPFNAFIAVAFFFCNCIVTLIFSASAWIMTYTWFILPSAWILWFVFKNARYWVTFVLVASVVMMQGLLLYARFLAELNMGGAVICLVCLLCVLSVPKIAFPNTADLV